MRQTTRNFYQTAIAQAVSSIAGDLDGALDLAALARNAALSTFHFHRMFRGLIGETPLEVHRRLRLERAAWQLLHTDAPVTQIAFAAGYDTHEAFTRVFGTSYACTPSAFRASRDPATSQHHATFRIQLANRLGLHFPDIRMASNHTFPTTGTSTMHVEIRTLPQQRLATIEHRGPYNRISDAFARLGQIAGPAGLFGADAAMIALYFDDPETTPANELRAEAALSIGNEKGLPPTLGERHLAAGRYACTVHSGGYELIGDTWARLMGEWLPDSGLRIAEGPSFERYLNTPMDVPTDQLRTEIYVPVV